MTALTTTEKQRNRRRRLNEAAQAMGYPSWGKYETAVLKTQETRTMKKTIAQTIIDEMASDGYRFIGSTSGQFTFAKGSNLARYLDAQGLTEADVTVKAGAKRQHKTEGYELLVFVKE